MNRQITEESGRHLFGSGAETYAKIRPPYPDSFMERLASLKPESVLDVGSGDGRILAALIGLVEANFAALEPDKQFNPLLAALDPVLTVNATIEEAVLAPGSFDLVTVGTAFHWLDPDVRVALLQDLLAPGGRLALMWNLFGDHERQDPFHEASKGLLASGEHSPSGGPGEQPFALRKAERISEVTSGGFRAEDYLTHEWTLSLNPREVAELYSTFSEIQRLEPERRNAVLSGLERLAEKSFNGIVQRNMTSVLYLFQKI